jgi:hypothetical protein
MRTTKMVHKCTLHVASCPFPFSPFHPFARSLPFLPGHLLLEGMSDAQ